MFGPGNSFDSNSSNVLYGLALLFGVALLCGFGAALMGTHTAGEVAVALGAFAGGFIGAGVAILAVFIALSSQRQEETTNISAAIKTEVTALAKYAIGSIKKLSADRSGHSAGATAGCQLHLAKVLGYARYIFGGRRQDRLIAAGSRHRTILQAAFGSKGEGDSLQSATINQPLVSHDNAAKIADSLITALQLAHAIICDEGDLSEREQLEGMVRGIVGSQIDECLKSAKASVPNAELFQLPTGGNTI